MIGIIDHPGPHKLVFTQQRPWFCQSVCETGLKSCSKLARMAMPYSYSSVAGVIIISRVLSSLGWQCLMVTALLPAL